MAPTPWTPNQYPPARRSDHVDVYKSEKQGEVRVADPYQWLEEHTDETDVWTSAQDTFTRAYLDKNPDRAKLEKAIRENTNYEKVRSSMNVCMRSYDGKRWFTVLRAGVQVRQEMVLVL